MFYTVQRTIDLERLTCYLNQMTYYVVQSTLDAPCKELMEGFSAFETLQREAMRLSGAHKSKWGCQFSSTAPALVLSPRIVFLIAER